ncbi:MAG: M43 family zinc metalloprotease, partial [Myxococcota bacterium]
LSSSLPGPPWVGHTPRSGVALALGVASDDERAARVLAHELGHFLGLFHTQENNLQGAPTIYDAISDTPEGTGGRTNLMHFLVDTNEDLTKGQVAIMRQSPWLLPRISP